MRGRIAIILALIIAPCLLGRARFATAAETAALDPALPYQAERSNPVSYDVDFSIVVTPPYHAKQLRVWIPVPQSDVGQEYTEGTWTTFPMTVEPKLGTENVF